MISFAYHLEPAQILDLCLLCFRSLPRKKFFRIVIFIFYNYFSLRLVTLILVNFINWRNIQTSNVVRQELPPPGKQTLYWTSLNVDLALRLLIAFVWKSQLHFKRVKHGCWPDKACLLNRNLFAVPWGAARDTKHALTVSILRVGLWVEFGLLSTQ